MSVRSSARRYAPKWVTAIYSYLCWNLLIRPRWRRMGVAAVFTEHYQRNGWGVEESRSGIGSTIGNTEAVRTEIPNLIAKYQIRSLLDIPCGDFNWMKLIELPIKYIGADIVEELIVHNRGRYESQLRSFTKLDLTIDRLPMVDLILCRDCLFHLSYRHIHEAIANIKRSGATFLLTTTNPYLRKNKDIVSGEWRRLNLQIFPFLLSKPILFIDEKSPDPADDRQLGLWRISDI
jgi:hypothetical protein